MVRIDFRTIQYKSIQERYVIKFSRICLDSTELPFCKNPYEEAPTEVKNKYLDRSV